MIPLLCCLVLVAGTPPAAGAAAASGIAAAAAPGSDTSRVHLGQPGAGDLEYAHELSRGLDENKALGDLDAAAGWLRAQSRVDWQRIGVVGFCMGGRLSELMALHSPDLAAAVMFYGRPESDAGKLAALKAPLQGHFGGEDRGIGPDQVAALRAALAKAGKTGDIYVYAGAGHAFMHEGRPSYHADAARQAWARTLQFFQKYLKG